MVFNLRPPFIEVGFPLFPFDPFDPFDLREILGKWVGCHAGGRTLRGASLQPRG